MRSETSRAQCGGKALAGTHVLGNFCDTYHYAKIVNNNVCTVVTVTNVQNVRNGNTLRSGNVFISGDVAAGAVYHSEARCCNAIVRTLRVWILREVVRKMTRTVFQ